MNVKLSTSPLDPDKSNPKYMLPHLVPLATSSHFGSVHTKGAEELNLFSLEYGVQARYGVTNIQQKSSGISSSTETLLQLCDIVASNGYT